MAAVASSARPTAVPLPPHLKRAASKPTASTNGKSNDDLPTPVFKTQTSSNALPQRRKRKQETPVMQFTRWLVNNQTGLSANLFALLFLTHTLFPRARVHTTKFFTLSYFNPATGNYNLGSDDVPLILFLVVFFTGLRSSTMDYVLAPFARSQGLYRKKPITRFAEQAWLVIVYTVFFPLGVYLYYNSPYFLNMKNLWTHWPGREMPGLRKAYILVQLAFWLQQIIVINIEERRKDHWQMLTHHFVTVSLIAASYRYRHTPVANVILILMDISDFFLPLAKCQKYLGYTNICDVTFGAFMLSWFVCRHVFYSMICYSVWAQTPQIMPDGCFKGVAAGAGAAGAVGSGSPLGVPVGADEISSLTPTISKLAPFLSNTTSNKLAFLIEPMVHSDGAVCYNYAVKWGFLSMLLFLELIIIVWFFMIVQVAIRVVRGSGADDSRSDDENGDEEEEEEEADNDDFVSGGDGNGHTQQAEPLEEEVGVEALDLKGWERRTGVKRVASTSTGVSLPGHHSDRKELLGRIGCEKQVD
ncbi:Acyl-CoA-dependent ceramide synthase [Sporothrix schenckii 1099-18]|uniref:Acyl-CoA-dependent ceramide synthase n=1 Tax=Sporothrix schenckii 1099-18 TaxID=1397361 RepID=A0A0F2M8U6_SPOSC|nr:Acyl-CoA-dependent ceramide synthase [Sporothrix schenckii 1099-18]KJR86123.1 Acyl-CoA-dependent ceramide synthase [Sporothrix schenckii 1099-18]